MTSTAPSAPPEWRLLLRHEWRLLARERLPWLLGTVLLLLLGYGAWNGWHWARFQRQAIGRVLTDDAERLAALDSTLRLRAAGDSTVRVPVIGVLGATAATRHATLPPTALGALAVGTSDLRPSYARVSTRSKDTFLSVDEIENPHHLLAGRFDLAFVVVYLLPLLLLALTFNVVSGEREQGTLALLLTTSTPPARLLLAKLAVRVTLALGGTVLITLGLAVGVLAVDGSPLTELRSWAGIGLWLLLVLAYAAWWTALALAVNVRGYGSATNAMLLIGAWLLFLVIIPAGVAAGVSTVHPAPSRVTLTTALREASDAAAQAGDQAVAQYLADHPEMLRTGGLAEGNSWARTIALQERTAQAMRPVYAAFDSALAAQERSAAAWRLLSPAVVLMDALHDVAGRGVGRYRHFERQLDVHHQAWQQFFFQRIFANQTADRELLGALPVFRYLEEPLSEVLGRTLPALAFLLALTGLLSGWALRRLGSVTPISR
jgi:ABC-2 type transport system permease protein